MKRLKFVREIGTKSIVFPIQGKNKDLGYFEDTPFSSEKQNKRNVSVRYIGTNRLEECRSFNINEPYIVGVNGIEDIKGDLITYKIDGTKYITNRVTGETNIELLKSNTNYTDTFLIRDKVGFTFKPLINDIQVERGKQNIIENFFRLKNVESLKDFNETGFGFYTVFNQTL